jgi:hypothetical protein
MFSAPCGGKSLEHNVLSKAVPLAVEHSFKTGLNTILGQYCHLRMGQGLTGAPGPYSKLKGLAMGPFSDPYPEPALAALREVGFEYFITTTGGQPKASKT